MWCDAMEWNAMQCNTMQYNAILCIDMDMYTHAYELYMQMHMYICICRMCWYTCTRMCINTSISIMYVLTILMYSEHVTYIMYRFTRVSKSGRNRFPPALKDLSLELIFHSWHIIAGARLLSKLTWCNFWSWVKVMEISNY